MTIRLAVAGVRHPHIDTIIAEAGHHDDVELVGIAEGDRELRGSYTARYGVRGYDDHAQLLDSGTADVIAVGDVYSARGAIVADALRSGHHVLADKPLCTTRADLDAIHAAWRGGDRLLSIAFEKRFYASTLALSEVLAQAELGEITMVTATGPHKLTRHRRPDWMFDAASYGGILNDLTVHDIDLLLHLTGVSSGQVRGHAGNRGNTDRPGFEDHGLAVVETDGGPIAALDAHWLSPEAAPYHGDYRMRLVGTGGTADVLWKDDELVVATHERSPRDVPLPPRRRAAADFVDALRAGREPSVTASDALAATSVALAAQESARAGRPVTWDIAGYLPGSGGAPLDRPTSRRTP
ncbi:Gfo/Idh/MocA family protein [Jiangella asiatica]|uniref:Gfo/Idh/MocA family oxidoreductase n=1 Tax=Jiangella asiatica TaxID=2530372 RepID=A0A4R5CPD4_9ACTN|nr:Gfo/Idh/MocA family oxidoreductase [Jiangella asiatica]TDE01976.1 Gfo/Idh/MocA family oxidoreductase [Jiangella asiatica]